MWLAAAVADYHGRRSLLEEIRQDPLAVFKPEWVGIDSTTDPVLATYFLFHDTDLDTLRTPPATVAPCDLSRVYAETSAIDPARLPSTYPLPTGDRTLRPQWMARIALERLGTEPIDVPGGHCPHVATPEAIAEIISEACKCADV